MTPFNVLAFSSGVTVGLCIGFCFFQSLRKVNKKYQKDMEEIHNKYLKLAHDRNLKYAGKLDEIQKILSKGI